MVTIPVMTTHNVAEEKYKLKTNIEYSDEDIMFQLLTSILYAVSENKEEWFYRGKKKKKKG
jgi:hypothetical protein